MQRVKEVDDAFSELVLEIELFALRYLLATLKQVARAFVDILQEILSSRLEKQNLVIVVAMVGQVTALLTDQLVVQLAVRDVVSPVVRTQGHLAAWARVLLVRLMLLRVLRIKDLVLVPAEIFLPLRVQSHVGVAVLVI